MSTPRYSLASFAAPGHPAVKLDTSLSLVDSGVSGFRGKHRSDKRNALAQFLGVQSSPAQHKAATVFGAGSDSVANILLV